MVEDVLDDDGLPVGDAVSVPDGDGFPETVGLVVALGVALSVLVEVSLGFGVWLAVRLARGVLDSSGAVFEVCVFWVFGSVAGGGRTSR